MKQSGLVALLALMLAPAGALAQPPLATPQSQAAHQVTWPEGLRARLLRDEPSAVRSLDPAIFTEISPVTASEPAVRLPPDQQDEDPETDPRR
ncbi:MAG: hypothetical protein ACNA7W_01960 [Pseudomonadales bacterium]